MPSEGILVLHHLCRVNSQSCKMVFVKSAENRPRSAVLDAKRSGTALQSVNRMCVILFIYTLPHCLIFALQGLENAQTDLFSPYR